MKIDVTPEQPVTYTVKLSGLTTEDIAVLRALSYCELRVPNVVFTEAGNVPYDHPLMASPNDPKTQRLSTLLKMLRESLRKVS